MRKRKIFATLTLMMLLTLPALGESWVSGRIAGNSIEVSWQAPQGNGELTVYQGDWPICVRNVPGGAGSATIPVDDPAASYRLRLNVDGCCWTAKVEGAKPTATQAPTAEPTAVPTAEVTIVPTAEPTAEPPSVPTAVPTAAPTAKPTARPTNVPTTKPTAAPTRQPAVSNRSDLAAQVVAEVNAERSKRGLQTLRVDGELTRAACVRAGEIIQSFGHTRPDGTRWSTVSGSAYAENIARGQNTANKVMAAWMSSSEGHRENILHASYGSIGVCVTSHKGVIYWVQLFGR